MAFFIGILFALIPLTISFLGKLFINWIDKARIERMRNSTNNVKIALIPIVEAVERRRSEEPKKQSQILYVILFLAIGTAVFYAISFAFSKEHIETTFTIMGIIFSSFVCWVLFLVIRNWNPN